jgi:hypothetical protein
MEGYCPATLREYWCARPSDSKSLSGDFRRSRSVALRPHWCWLSRGHAYPEWCDDVRPRGMRDDGGVAPGVAPGLALVTSRSHEPPEGSQPSGCSVFRFRFSTRSMGPSRFQEVRPGPAP